MPAALTLLLAGVFLASGAAKLRDPAGMVVLLRQALAPTVPAFALVRALAVLELAVGAVLLVGVAARPAAGASACLLVAFTVALRFAARRAPEAAAACSCFGGSGGAPVGRAAARNALLLAAAAWIAVDPGVPWELPADELAGAATVAVGLPCAWLLLTVLAPDGDPQSASTAPLPMGGGGPGPVTPSRRRGGGR